MIGVAKGWDFLRGVRDEAEHSSSRELSASSLDEYLASRLLLSAKEEVKFDRSPVATFNSGAEVPWSYFFKTLRE